MQWKKTLIFCILHLHVHLQKNFYKKEGILNSLSLILILEIRFYKYKMAISVAPDKHVLAVNKSEQNNINDYIKTLVKIITFWREILTNKIYLTV